VPEDLKVEDIVKLIEQHYTDFPTHGVGCSCIDPLIGKIRQITTYAKITERIGNDPESQLKRKIQGGIDHVLHLANRRYY
jgi:hypothetical protein